MANEIVNRTVNVFINSGEAQKAFDALIKKEQQLKDALTKATDPKIIKQLNAEMAKMAEPIDRAKKKLSGELLPTFKDLQAATTKFLNEFKKTGDPAALANFQKFNAALQEQKRLINGLKDTQQSLTSGGIFSATFWANLAVNGIQRAGEALKQFFVGSLEEALHAEKVDAQLKNILENFGRTDLLEKFKQKAEELGKTFQTFETTDIKGVFQQLITYGKLSENQINQLTPVILNFASKSGKSLEESTGLITKALEGNSRGLKDYGISIKDGSTVTQRFGIIMRELEPRVRGAEQAFEQTNAGAIARFKTLMREAKEAIGNFIFGLRDLEGQQLKNAISAKQDADRGQVLVFRYEELSKKVNKTAAEKAELISITNQLGVIFGTSVVQIDKETGALTLNVAATKDLIKQKLLLANSKAAELASKINATEEEQVTRQEEIVKQTKLLDFQQKQVGKSFQDLVKLYNSSDAGKRKILDDQTLKNLYAQGVALFTLKTQASNATQKIDDLTKDLKELGFTKADIDKLFKPGSATSALGGAAASDGGISKEEANKLKALQDEIRKNGERLLIDSLFGGAKELAELDARYSELRDKAKGNATSLAEVERQYQQERSNLIRKFTEEELDAERKRVGEAQKNAAEKVKIEEDRLKRILEFTVEQQKKLEKLTESLNKSSIAGDELKVSQSVGKKKLQAEIELLNDQERIELSQKNITETEKLNIEQKYRGLRLHAEIDFEKNKLETIIGFAQIAFSAANSFTDSITSKENTELEADRRRNDQKRQNLDRRLQKGLISQGQYDKEIQKIEGVQEKRQHEIAIKQFRRKQALDLGEALINGTLAVLMDLKTIPKVIPGTIIPNPQLPLAIALDVATAAAKIAVIAAQKPPQFASGGKLEGRSHTTGGNAVIDGSGQKIAEVEAGEGIVNKQTMGDGRTFTASGTPSQIISSLNGLYGKRWDSGATLMPQWRTISPQRMNFAAMKRYYAEGGLFQQSANQNNNIVPADPQLIEVINDLRFVLANGIKAYTLISDQEKQQLRLNNIRADATLKG